ncbi:MAG: CRISPR system precrRNA processing endoribonuclease RAMP protein Cas6 [Candidatus Bathyarchaeota archaeon]|nr:CRISPR system precrRNA processing endoribonuclease RAMP protein Cas6 [Candidatus Bathyarchaeota archaeon]
MPVEVGLELYGEKGVVLPFFTGHVARGLLLHIVRQVDPSAADVLHELNVSKPYSVTPLRFRSVSRVENGFVLDPAHPCRVGFRFLRDDLAGYVLRFFEQQNSVMIFDTVFRVASLSINGKSYKDLQREASATKRFRLVFKTPTYLPCLGSSYRWMFPDAIRVFSGLMRLWNKFSDSRRFSKEEFLAYKKWLGENVGVCGYRLGTKLTVMRDRKAVGFLGWCAYEMRDMESEWNKVTVMLAKYAEYSNIGGNKTAGYGVTMMILA